MSQQTDILIIGAGPTGLGAAWRLHQLGHADWLLCEAEGSPGGLATSIVDEHGFTWDLGGHVQFSHYDHFDDLMDELLGVDGWLYHQRESWIWLHGTFVPYPFQLNLHRLPNGTRWECVRGLVRLAKQPPARRPENFGEWIDPSFGDGIARTFLRPYKFKVWAYPPEQLAWSWIGERVATVDLERVLDNIFHERDDVSWGPNNQFRFPKQGGTGAVWTTLFQRLHESHPSHMRLRHGLVRLDTARQEAHFADREPIRYRQLISTLPLDKLVRLSDMAQQLEPALGNLRYSSTHVIGVGLHGSPPAHLAKKCWMYFPEDDCPFYRVTVFSNYSPNNVPDIRRYWSLMAEVSESPCKHVAAERVVEETIQGLLNTGLIPDRQAVHHTWYRRLPHGYPTPSLTRDAGLNAIQPALESRHVYSRGRFGAWKYEVSNQDHSFAQGVEVVDRLLRGAPEETLNLPEMVNSRRPKARAAAQAQS